MKPRSQIADPGLFQAILSLSQPTAFQRAFLRREDQLLLTFFDDGSRQLKLNRASLAKYGSEFAGPLFSTWCSSACRSTCKLVDLKSPAPIPDPSVFCACPVSNGTGLGFSSGRAGRKIGLRFVNSLAETSFVSRAPSAVEASWLVTDFDNREW